MKLELDDLKDGQRRLAEELRNMVRDAEQMLQHQVNDASEGYKIARSKLEKTVTQAARELEGAERVLLERTRKAAHATDHYVHQHPWESIGVGAGIGVLLGLLIGRK